MKQTSAPSPLAPYQTTDRLRCSLLLIHRTRLAVSAHQLLRNLDYLVNKMESDAVPMYPQVYPKAQIVSRDNLEQPNGGQQSMLMPLSPHQGHLLLGPENTVTTCIFCHASIKTAVKYTSNSRTHIAAALWCLACCLCCVPYASETAKNTDHYCPNCQRYLGTYHK